MTAASPAPPSAIDAASPSARRDGPRAWSGRMALSAFGASVAGLFVSGLDALYAQRGSVAGAPPPLGPLALVDLGLVFPVALAAGLAVGAGLVLLEPRAPLSPRVLVDRLRGPEGELSRALRSARAALSILGAGLFAIVVAQLARRMLASEEPPAVVGAWLSLLAVTLCVVLGLLGRVLAGPTARAFRRARLVDPLACSLGALTIVAILFAIGITSGTSGGDGGLFGVLGVLKRQELDLRVPGLLLLLSLGAALGPALHGRLFAPLALVLSLLPAVLTARAARVLDAQPSLDLEMERSAPLARVGLRLLRRAADRDHDGFAGTFGGGDCNDHDPRINPAAYDEPGNGIDEDCSGSDAPVPVVAPPVAQGPARPAEPDAKGARAPENLSVILITIDTLRADLGFAGYPRAVTPNLDALARRAVVFERAYSLASYTGKSVGPMLTGKYPSETHRGWSHFNSFSKDDIMIAERLKEAGIKTLSVQGHWYFERFSGLGRGFDTLDTSAFPPAGTQADTDSNTTSEKITDAAIKRLAVGEMHDARFFAWVHYLDPHADYLHHADVPDFGRLPRDQYDNEVAFTDKHIGRLLDWLAAQPWAAHVAVIVTSDHGEAFGEHKLFRHGFEIFEEFVRVPLLVLVPGAEPHRVAERRSLIDLVPTILDLYRLEPAFGATRYDFVSGKSLLPDIAPPPGSTPEPRDIFVDMPAGPNNDERRAFFHGDRKLYISSGFSYQLFDLAADPAEKTDLGESNKEALAEMRARYDAFRGGLREVRVKPIPK